LRGAGSGDRTRRGVAGSGPLVTVGAADPVASEVDAVHQGAFVTTFASGIRRVAQTVLGQHIWARGYFCATVGAVDEATIKAHIENQRWDEDDESFKITAPTKP
jgi:putative transposase